MWELWARCLLYSGEASKVTVLGRLRVNVPIMLKLLLCVLFGSQCETASFPLAFP